VEMPSGKTRLAALGAGSVLAAAVLWLVYTWPVTVQYFPSYAVTYSKGLGQSFELEVVNETGHPVRFCAALYGWLPNGSFVEVGRKCGRGRVSLDPAPLRKYAEAWEGFKGVEPGVVVLLTYVNGSDAAGKPNLARTAKSFTIQPGRVLQGENIKATVKVRGKPPKEEPRQQGKLSLSFQWPPPGIVEECIYDPSVPATYCYEWRLDTVYYSAVDTKVPTVAARVVNAAHAYYIHPITLYFSLNAATPTAVYFSGSAAISGAGSSVSYSQDVYALVLINSSIKNSTDEWSLGFFSPRREGVGVYVVGFYGDVAVARYKERVVTSTPYGMYVSETGYVADMYLLRPSAARMQRGVLALFQDKDPGPTDNYGYSQIFNRLANYWNFKDKRGDWGVGVASSVVINEISGALTISIGIPLLSNLPVSPNLAVTIGSTDQLYASASVFAHLADGYESYFDIYIPGITIQMPCLSTMVDITVYHLSL